MILRCQSSTETSLNGTNISNLKLLFFNMVAIKVVLLMPYLALMLTNFNNLNYSIYY